MCAPAWNAHIGIRVCASSVNCARTNINKHDCDYCRCVRACKSACLRAVRTLLLQLRAATRRPACVCVRVCACVYDTKEHRRQRRHVTQSAAARSILHKLQTDDVHRSVNGISGTIIIVVVVCVGRSRCGRTTRTAHAHPPLLRGRNVRAHKATV